MFKFHVEALCKKMFTFNPFWILDFGQLCVSCMLVFVFGSLWFCDSIGLNGIRGFVILLSFGTHGLNLWTIYKISCVLLFFSMKDFQNAHDNELCFNNEWFWWWYITIEVEVLRPHCDNVSTSSALALLKIPMDTTHKLCGTILLF